MNPARHFQCGTCGRQVWLASADLFRVRSTSCKDWRIAIRTGETVTRPLARSSARGPCDGRLYPTPGRVLDDDGRDLQLIAPLMR